MRKTHQFALAVTALTPMLIYLVVFNGGISDEHGRWGEFGSYLSGIYGSLALAVLTYTTYLTQSQFKRQNEDSVFYKLIDSLHYRIEHSSVSKDGEDFSAHKSLKYIVDRVYAELSEECVELGRRLFCETPEDISDVHYYKLFEAINPQNWIDSYKKDRSDFIADMNAQGHYYARRERLKFYVGSRGAESESVKSALHACGSVNFYKIPFDERQISYRRVVERVLNAHGEFLDGYFATLLYISEMISNSSNREQYARYLRSQLTRYDVVILFYMIAGQVADHPSHGRAIYALGLLDRLRTTDCQTLMIDLPSVDEINEELKNIFKGRD